MESWQPTRQAPLDHAHHDRSHGHRLAVREPLRRARHHAEPQGAGGCGLRRSTQGPGHATAAKGRLLPRRAPHPPVGPRPTRPHERPAAGCPPPLGLRRASGRSRARQCPAPARPDRHGHHHRSHCRRVTSTWGYKTDNHARLPRWRPREWAPPVVPGSDPMPQPQPEAASRRRRPSRHHPPVCRARLGTPFGGWASVALQGATGRAHGRPRIGSS